MTIVTKYGIPPEQLEPHWTSARPSLTVPDQTLSVRELLERFTTGLLTPQSVWHEDVGDDFSDLDNPNPADSPDFDLTDRDALRESASLAADQLTQAASRQRRSAKSEKEQLPSEAKRSEKGETPSDE